MLKIFPNIGGLLLLCLFLYSCNQSNNKLKPTESESSGMETEGNAIDQTNPTLMVFPSDALLKRLNCIKEVENQGITSYERNYNKAFIQDSELKFTISSIEECFSKVGYPLENLEQQLKQLTNDNAMDATEGIAKDARTMLMSTARPDFIIEIDYEYKQDQSSRNPKKILTYMITAIDVYTNKTIASVTRSDIGKVNENENNTASPSFLIKSDLENNITDFQTQIKQRFSDELANGIEISLRLCTETGVNFNLSDECLGDENYNDWVNTWLKKNTVKSSFKPVKNTNKELKYTNVRIKPKTENGERYTAYDFANDLKQAFAKACGIKSSNKTQSIGDAYIVVSGLK